MKLGTIVNNQNVIKKIRNAQLPANKVFRLRKALKSLTAEIEQWNELREEYIKKHGEKGDSGNVVIKPGTKAFSDFIEYANSVFAEEVDGPKEGLTEEDLTEIPLSVAELDQLEAIGLLKS